MTKLLISSNKLVLSGNFLVADSPVVLMPEISDSLLFNLDSNYSGSYTGIEVGVGNSTRDNW